MLTSQDIKSRNVIIVNAIEGKKLNVMMGNIVIKDSNTDEILTKLSFYKVFAIFVIGHLTITSQVLEGCSKHGVNLVILKPSFKPFFRFGNGAEANYLLRERQYRFEHKLVLATKLLHNKAFNQINLLKSIRDRSEYQNNAIKRCEEMLLQLNPNTIDSLALLMGFEGNIAKLYFTAIFDFPDWSGRKPRAKLDPYNVTLDIGYTFLFNFIECFVGLFGFDVYYGVCHQSWFKRKSLICDLVEPFRCIIDIQVRKSFRLKQFKLEHFTKKHKQYSLIREYNSLYTEVFATQLIAYKDIIFLYIQSYYRCFMGKKSIPEYPRFNYANGLVEYADN